MPLRINAPVGGHLHNVSNADTQLVQLLADVRDGTIPPTLSYLEDHFSAWIDGINVAGLLAGALEDGLVRIDHHPGGDAYALTLSGQAFVGEHVGR